MRNITKYSLLLAITLLMATLTFASAFIAAPASAQAPTDWPMFRHDPAHTGVSASTAPDKFKVAWRYKTDGPVYSSPAVVGGKVYVGSDDSNLYCLDGATGSLVWKYETESAVVSSPAVVDGKVYFGSLDKNVYCLDAAGGTLVWKYLTGNMVFSSPCVVDGEVYIGSMDKNLYCLDAATGTLVWSYEMGFLYKVSPAVVGGRVYIGSDDRKVTCLNAADGTLVWNTTTGSTIGQSSPAVVDGKVYIGGDDQKIHCFDAADGTELWNYNTAQTNYQDYVRNSPAVWDGKVYVGFAHQFTAFNADTGAVEWEFHSGSIQRSSPAVADGRVYFGHNDLNMYIFDAVTGSRLQSYPASSPWESSVSVADGKLYCGNGNNYVYCFDQAVAPVSTTLSCTVTPTAPTVGTPVVVEGFIFPGVAWVGVTLTYTKPDATTLTFGVLAKVDGGYAHFLDPDDVVPGTWSVQASWPGDTLHAGSSSSAVSFTVTGTLPPTPPTATMVNCWVDPASMRSGETTYVRGAIKPAVSGATVTLTYTKPDATTTTRTATTAGDGTYEDSLALDDVGAWNVRASWAGDATHTAATSNYATINVAAEAAPAEPVEGIQTEVVYAVVAGFVIIVVVLVLFMFLRRK